MTRLQIIGGGRMGEAMLIGLLRSGFASPGEITVVEPLASRRAEVAAANPGVTVRPDMVLAEGAIVAVKPNDVPEVVSELAASGCKRVLSIAAGVTLATLEAAAGNEIRIVRAMPNTAATVGAGAAAIAGGSTAREEDLVWAESILGAVGTVVRVTESQLDAVTGLSGSGPAYIYLVVEALADAGVLVGLSRPVAEMLATQTLIGAAELLASGAGSPVDLRSAVTSPGGTTAAGIHQLERHAVRGAFLDAVVAATRRSRELG